MAQPHESRQGGGFANYDPYPHPQHSSDAVYADYLRNQPRRHDLEQQISEAENLLNRNGYGAKFDPKDSTSEFSRKSSSAAPESQVPSIIQAAEAAYRMRTPFEVDHPEFAPTLAKYLPGGLSGTGPWLSSHIVMPEDLSSDAKVEKRRARERESARRSRRRKKELLETLEQRMNKLSQENAELKKQLQVSQFGGLEESFQNLLMEMENMVSHKAPDEEVDECVKNVKSTFLKKTTAVSQHLADVQAILHPIRQSEVFLWLLSNMALVDHDEDLSQVDSDPSSAATSLVKAAVASSGAADMSGSGLAGLADLHNEKRQRLDNGGVDGPGLGSGSGMETLARVERAWSLPFPVGPLGSDAEMGRRMCRQLLAAINLSSVQRMQVRLFFATRRDKIAAMNEKHLEIIDTTIKLGNLRKQHQRDWAELGATTDIVVCTLSPVQRARFWLAADRFSAMILDMITKSPESVLRQVSSAFPDACKSSCSSSSSNASRPAASQGLGTSTTGSGHGPGPGQGAGLPYSQPQQSGYSQLWPSSVPSALQLQQQHEREVSEQMLQLQHVAMPSSFPPL